MENAVEGVKRRPDFAPTISVIFLRLDSQAEGNSIEPTVLNSVLQGIARSLEQNFRPTDALTPLSYYKLATLNEELRDPEEINIIIRRIQTILTPPFKTNDDDFTLSFQIGRALNQLEYK